MGSEPKPAGLAFMWQITAAPTDREILDPRFELGAGVGFKREEEFVSQSSFASLPRTGPEDPDYWYGNDGYEQTGAR